MDDSDDQKTEVIANLNEDGMRPSAGGKEEPVNKKQDVWRRKSTWVVAGILAALAIIVIGGGLWNVHAKNEAMASCRQEADTIRTLDRKPTDKVVSDALKVDKGDVANIKAWDTLQTDKKELANLKQDAVPKCDSGSRNGAQRQQQEISAHRESLESAMSSVSIAAKGVLASRDAKVFKDTRDGLSAKTGDAKQLLASSDGKVADDATRSALSQQIDTASRMLDDKKTKTGDLQQELQALDNAMNAVTASVQDKSTADAQAAQAELDIQTPQPTASPKTQETQRTQTSRVPSQTSKSGGSGRAGQSSQSSVPSRPAPQPSQSQPSQPVPQSSVPSRPAPQPSQSQPSRPSANSGFDLTGTVNPNCVAGHTGVCPIG